MEHYINQKYLEPGNNYFAYGSQINVSKNKVVKFKNLVVSSGTTLMSWDSKVTHLNNFLTPSLPILKAGERYRINVGLKAVPENSIITRIKFYNIQDEEINRLEFFDHTKEFTYPTNAVNYEVDLINAGCEAFELMRIQLGLAKLPKNSNDDIWYHKPVNKAGNEPINILIVKSKKHFNQTYNFISSMIGSLPLMVISLAWQYDDDPSWEIFNWLKENNIKVAHLISIDPKLDYILLNLKKRLVTTQILLANQVNSTYNKFPNYWDSINTTDPDWPAIIDKIKQEWGDDLTDAN